MTRKRPMTTEELFNMINGILKEKGKLPDILGYGLATYNPVPITNYEYDLKNNLDYGENEGICTNCGRSIDLFDYGIWRWYLCKLHKISLNYTVNTSPPATSRRRSKPL